MSRKTQRYSKEFKAEAVRTVLENQLSISEGASRLSLPEGTLGQWVTAARKGLGTPGSRTVAELESEILQLRKALNEARLERDILKKAAVDSIGQRNSYVKTWGCAMAGIPFRPANKACNNLGMPLHGANRRTSSPFTSPCLQAN